MTISFNRILHTIFYGVGLFIVIAVLTMPICILEKAIHTFAWIYLFLAYSFFFDSHPPRILQIKGLYWTKEEEEQKQYVEKVDNLSKHVLSLMRKIQLHENYLVVNASIAELKERYRELQQLEPPSRYLAKHLEILRDVQGFIAGLSEGDYYLVQAKTH